MPKSVNKSDVVKGLERILPIARLIASNTPNKYDDAAVSFLEQLLAASNPQEAVAAALAPPEKP